MTTDRVSSDNMSSKQGETERSGKDGPSESHQELAKKSKEQKKELAALRNQARTAKREFEIEMLNVKT